MRNHSCAAFSPSASKAVIDGRGGSFRYNNTDHSIETGMLAAKNLLGEHHDLEDVNADNEYHEMKKVAAAQSAT